MVTEQHHFHGGVSPRSGGRPTYGLSKLKPPVDFENGPAIPNFNYHGGPVICCPQIYTSFWGPAWLKHKPGLPPQYPLGPLVGLVNSFNLAITHSNFMNVLSQYGVGFGNGAAGAFISQSYVSDVTGTLTDSDIRHIIQSAIDLGALPEPTKPANLVLLIYLDGTIAVNDPTFPPKGVTMCEPTNDNAFGYHSHFTTSAGNPFYYAVVPFLDDSCVSETCPNNDPGCTLQIGQTQIERLTVITSHEFAEMTTNPEGTGWWDDDSGFENGDICAGKFATITVGSVQWAVQKIYSVYADIVTNGILICEGQAPDPEPRLASAPGCGVTGFNPRSKVSLDRLLPLPAVHVSSTNRSVSIDERELRLYVRRLFRPLRQQEIFANLPAYLREVANVLEGKK